MTLYEQVEEKVLPLITAYHNDLLVHDKTSIEGNPGVPFLHFTGDTGTHMVRLISAEEYPAKGARVKYLFGTAGRDHLLDEVVSAIRQMPRVNRRDLVLYFNGIKLQEINQVKAEEIAEKYRHKIRREWSQRITA